MWNTSKTCHTYSFLCKHIFSLSHWTLQPLYARAVCFDLMTLSHLLSAFCSCETVHDVDIQEFCHLAPSNLMTTTVERRKKNEKKKKCSQRHRSVYIQVCQPSLFSHPSCLCLLCIAAKVPPPRWTEHGPLESDRSPRFPSTWRLRINTSERGGDLNSAWELANLKAEDSISLDSTPPHC